MRRAVSKLKYLKLKVKRLIEKNMRLSSYTKILYAH